MRKKEREKLLDDVWGKISKKGMPINVRKGTNIEIADYIREIVSKVTEEDEPAGTEEKMSGGTLYQICPKCKRTVGVSGFYCKWCGEMLRCSTY